jgi:hypothetical protein
MPEGIFFLMKDKSKEPEIKCQYYKHLTEIPQEFLSNLYAAHAKFESASYLQMKFDHYRVLSYSSDTKTSQNQKGIIGLILEEEEKIGNLEFFVRRNLKFILNRPDNQQMQAIFTRSLENYLSLEQVFEDTKVESISEIIVISGTDKYKSTLLRLGRIRLLNSQISRIYEKILNKEDYPFFRYIRLNLELPENVFLVLKVQKPERRIDEILSAIKPFLEKYFNYALEIFALFLLSPIIKFVSSKPVLIKGELKEIKSILDVLHETSDYYESFNDMLLSIVCEEGSIDPII